MSTSYRTYRGHTLKASQSVVHIGWFGEESGYHPDSSGVIELHSERFYKRKKLFLRETGEHEMSRDVGNMFLTSVDNIDDFIYRGKGIPEEFRRKPDKGAEVGVCSLAYTCQ